MTQPTNESRALAEQIVSRAIQEVVFRYNAYAPIISSFRIAYSDLIPTAGTDRYARLILNPEFVVKNELYMPAIIIHETLHVFFGHTTDKRTRLALSDTDLEHNRIVNIAEDCAINQFIREPLPAGAITPDTLSTMLSRSSTERNQTAEFYYDLIMSSPNKLALSTIPCAMGDANTQRVQDELDKMGIPHISEEEVNDKVVDTATQIAKHPGNQYGELADFARALLKPKVNWKPLLQAAIRNAEKKIFTIHTHSTYRRTSRRSTTVFFPKKYGHKLTVALSFDTSGSITADMINQFLAEVQTCLQYSDIKECALWHTNNYWYGTPAQLATDITKIYQSGGTSESCMGRAERHIKADLYIHFSDGYHDTNYGFKYPSKNMEIVWGNDKEIKEIRRF